jgi:SAM-dependent methyltransferase
MTKMPTQNPIADHWAKGDVYGLILAALARAGKSLDGLTPADLVPIDHFHARGFAATVDLADRLTVKPGDHILDIGCGLGGPARYFAKRYSRRVTGIDITPAFVEAARKLTALVGLGDQVTVELGDGQHLPYGAGMF